MTWLDEIPPEEKTLIDELKRRTLADLTPKLQEDPSLFYRFLKARDFNLKNAEAMLRNHIAWRRQYKVDTIFEDYKPSEVLEKYATISHIGYDKEGSVVRYLDLGRTDMKGMLRSTKMTELLNYTILILEEDVALLRIQSEKRGNLVTKIVYIYNFEEITFAKVTHKRIIDSFIQLARIYQDNYPERMKLFIHFNVSIYYTLGFAALKSVMASPLLDKVRSFGSVGYKEFLLEQIEADQLPMFLGGNRTDPDGDPMCKTTITFGQIVPKKYYLRKSEKTLSKAPDVEKLLVTRSSKVEKIFDVETAGSFLQWEFETKSRDIGFEVQYKENASHEGNPVVLFPKQRVNTYYEPETGTVKCEKAGIYILIFDNSYSWIFSKEVFYKAKIRDADEEVDVLLER